MVLQLLLAPSLVEVPRLNTASGTWDGSPIRRIAETSRCSLPYVSWWWCLVELSSGEISRLTLIRDILRQWIGLGEASLTIVTDHIGRNMRALSIAGLD